MGTIYPSRSSPLGSAKFLSGASLRTMPGPPAPASPRDLVAVSPLGLLRTVPSGRVGWDPAACPLASPPGDSGLQNHFPPSPRAHSLPKVRVVPAVHALPAAPPEITFSVGPIQSCAASKLPALCFPVHAASRTALREMLPRLCAGMGPLLRAAGQLPRCGPASSGSRTWQVLTELYFCFTSSEFQRQMRNFSDYSPGPSGAPWGWPHVPGEDNQTLPADPQPWLPGPHPRVGSGTGPSANQPAPTTVPLGEGAGPALSAAARGTGRRPAQVRPLFPPLPQGRGAGGSTCLSFTLCTPTPKDELASLQLLTKEQIGNWGSKIQERVPGSIKLGQSL